MRTQCSVNSPGCQGEASLSNLVCPKPGLTQAGAPAGGGPWGQGTPQAPPQEQLPSPLLLPSCPNAIGSECRAQRSWADTFLKKAVHQEWFLRYFYPHLQIYQPPLPTL